MIRKKLLVGAAALALGPLAFMAPANAYYKVGTCDPPGSASITMTIHRPAGHASWDFDGRIGDGQGRTWAWKIIRNGTLYDSGTATGTTTVEKILPVNTTKVRFSFLKAGGGVDCTVVLDGIS